jgi:uncharacterized HAD superfamily protein
VSDKPIIVVDIDNCLTQSDEVFRDLIREHTNGYVCFRQKDITQYNYTDCVDKRGHTLSEADWQEVLEKFLEDDVLENLLPVPGAIDAMHELAEFADLHIATARNIQGWAGTARWLLDNDVPNHQLHFVNGGRKHHALPVADFTIEDHYDQAVSFASVVRVSSILISYPWNKAHKHPDHPVLWVKEWDGLPKQIKKLWAASNQGV